jgi:hypothetical protein
MGQNDTELPQIETRLNIIFTRFAKRHSIRIVSLFLVATTF